MAQIITTLTDGVHVDQFFYKWKDVTYVPSGDGIHLKLIHLENLESLTEVVTWDKITGTGASSYATLKTFLDSKRV